jgi:hypothetical protein
MQREEVTDLSSVVCLTGTPHRNSATTNNHIALSSSITQHIRSKLAASAGSFIIRTIASHPTASQDGEEDMEDAW